MELVKNALSYKIRGAAFRIHTAPGPGLLESVYEKALAFELRKLNCDIKTQVGIPMIYEDIRMNIGFRADLLVDNAVMVEIKSCDGLTDVHHKQLLTYLKLSGKKLGLLINFNSILLKNSIVRIANHL